MGQCVVLNQHEAVTTSLVLFRSEKMLLEAPQGDLVSATEGMKATPREDGVSWILWRSCL